MYLSHTDDDDPVAISALQHLLYCQRQFALIYLERQWLENRFTAEGRVLHERANESGVSIRKGVRHTRSMPIRSLRYGIAGVADVVELHQEGGSLRPFPVEYKRGKPKRHRADEVQLCAQALCLEEMFNCSINEGALFYGTTKRREVITFDTELRRITVKSVSDARLILSSNRTPLPVYEARKCDSCSLKDVCCPEELTSPPSASAWLTEIVSED
jgi:CRISPR-associated exonuclease Cas4